MSIAGTITALSLLAVPAWTLSGDRAQVISAHELQQQLAGLTPQAQAAGSSGSTITGYGNLTLKLSVRTASGGAEVHAHYDDLMIVEQGSATLVSGGVVLNAKTGSDGETHGSGIEGGTRQSLAVGDVVVVPAGVPHQLLIPPHTLYSALVAKVKE